MTNLTIPDNFKISAVQFEILASANRELRLERNATGELIIMPPTGGNTGKRNIKISCQLEIWNSQTNLGVAFDSSTAFTLPNGAQRSPDASWVKIKKWNQLTLKQQDSFPPICPDFVIELRSPTDTLKNLQQKMSEYINNGASLGWLIDPQQQTVGIYRPQQEVKILNSPQSLSGENILPGFILDLASIWN
jgi:Uma2 family endonuclease